MLHITINTNFLLLGDGTSTAIARTQCPNSLKNVELGWLGKSLDDAGQEILRVLEAGIKARTFKNHWRQIQGDEKRVMLNLNEVPVHLSGDLLLLSLIIIVVF